MLLYKLLLVDDEEDVREGLLHEMDWESCGFRVAGMAENGREAMECIERSRPDVVVTDIQMPFMNGLQLAEYIRAHSPAIKIVILTGYDEFEYAQKAIRLHIDEYVLKPFSAQELSHVLLKVRAQMDEEMELRDNLQQLQEHMRRSLPILREVFLSSLLRERMSALEIEDKIVAYDMKLDAKGYLAAVISLELTVQHSPLERGLKRYAVYNIAEEILSRDGLGMSLIHHDDIVLIGMEQGEQHLSALRTQIMNCCEEIRQAASRYAKVTVTIGIGSLICELTELSYSYQDAKHALDYRMVLGTGRLICIDDVETREQVPLRFDELKERALLRCLKVGTDEELIETMRLLFSSFHDNSFSISDVQIYLMEMLLTIMKVARDTGVQLEESAQRWRLHAPSELMRFPVGMNLFDQVRSLRDAEEAERWMTALCSHLMRHIVKDRQTSYHKLVEDAKDYVNEHYADCELSIAMVCQHLHISTGYFSSIFKKETRMTFIAYLLQLRMEQAKELLRTTDLKAFEIADRIGYADANYFSYSFKKQVGMSPKDYRNGLE